MEPMHDFSASSGIIPHMDTGKCTLFSFSIKRGIGEKQYGVVGSLDGAHFTIPYLPSYLSQAAHGVRTITGNRAWHSLFHAPKPMQLDRPKLPPRYTAANRFDSSSCLSDRGNHSFYYPNSYIVGVFSPRLGMVGQALRAMN